MSDKYLNFDIDDPRSSAIAEVMSNKTSKKILSLIAEKEMTGSDIAKELNLPLNTVGYNIDKLLKAGLIETSKNFFWSSKGKKMPTYKLSNKKILISPKRMIPNSVLAVFGSIIGIILLFAIIASIQNDNSVIIPSNSSKIDGNLESVFKNFGSNEELQNYIKSNSLTDGYSLSYRSFAETAVSATSDSSAPSASGSSKSSGASDYSQTNIQVEGVDEPDIVKNDGKYIYIVSGNDVVIVDAYPAEDMINISSIEVNNSIRDIFVNGDKLIVFSEGYLPVQIDSVSDVATGVAKMIAPCYGGCGFGKSLTNVYTYDITDRNNPKIESNFSIEGNYVSARMIGNHVYLISSKYAYQDSLPPIYYLNGIKAETVASDVLYYPGFEDQSFSFTSVVSLNIDNQEVNKKVYLTGSASTIYASKENIYITYTKRMPYREYNKQMLTEAIIPILPNSLIEKSDIIMDSDKDISEKYQEIMVLVYEYSNSLDGEDKESFDSDLQDSINSFESKISKESEKTVIMKVNVNKNDISLTATGEVIGHLLNQFSMDEFEDNLRIATTTGDLWSGNSLNHLFVLDESLDVMGSVEDLAPGEKIYSVRFMESKAYIVTFKKVDPFYVIDLSDPKAPNVLGYLKIPGYSDYLHPYDENHVIGIGKNARGGGEKFAYYQGIKISLFDVSDFENPKEVAKLDIGERGTDSSALYDHKAFLFDKSKNLLVIPISLAEVDEEQYEKDYNGSVPEWAYGETIWQGAYVININENSIEVKGKISHIDESENKYGPAKDEEIGAQRTDYNGNIWTKIAINAWKTQANGYEYETYYDYQIDGFPEGYSSYQNRIYDYRTQIQRSLFMDDVLYTVSQTKVKANDLNSLDEINMVDFDSSSIDYGYPILY